MAGYVMRSTVIVPGTVAVLEQGQTVAKGAAVDLPESYGDHLVAERLAERVQYDDPSPGLSDDDVREAVADILAEIGEEEGGDGVPNMDIVRAALVKAGAVSAAEARKRVTVELRDAVWAELQV